MRRLQSSGHVGGDMGGSDRVSLRGRRFLTGRLRGCTSVERMLIN